MTTQKHAAPNKPPAFERHSAVLAFVGGVGFMAAIMLFLAWIQPVNSERDKITLPPTFSLKLKPKSMKEPSRPQKKSTEKEVARKPRPQRKKTSRQSPRRTVSKQIRRPAINVSLRTFAGSGSIGAISLGAGPGLGTGLTFAQDFGGDVVDADVKEWELYEKQDLQAKRDRYATKRTERTRTGGKATAAKIKYAKKPNYPKKAKQNNVPGSVRLQILVGQDGRVEDFEIEHANPPGYFEDAITSVLDEWIFAPAKDSEGRPISEWTSFVYNFKLKDAIR